MQHAGLHPAQQPSLSTQTPSLSALRMAGFFCAAEHASDAGNTAACRNRFGAVGARVIFEGSMKSATLHSIHPARQSAAGRSSVDAA